MKLLTMFPIKKLVLAIAPALVLMGCDSDVQDQGKVATSQQVLSGSAIDGYIARGTVFIDSNNNGTRDAWETFAFTDNQGYFSYNSLTDTDYCAVGATEQQAQYCLKTNVQYNEVVIRIDGGYDLLTGEPFLGQLSRRIDNINAGSTVNALVSPITSLFTEIKDSSTQSSLLTALGLEVADLDVDYLNNDNLGGIDEVLFNKAVKIQKAVTLLADELIDIYTKIGDELGTPNDATAFVFNELAASLIRTGNSIETTLADSDELDTILANSETKIRDIYVKKELSLPPNPITDTTRVKQIVGQLSAVIDNLLPIDIHLDQSDAKGGASALEILVIKAVEETVTNTSIDNVISFFTSSDITTEANRASLITKLAQADADLNALKNNSFSDQNNVLNNATIAGGVLPFELLAGKSIKFSDQISSNPNDLQDKEFEFYFQGDSNVTEGAFSACVKLIDGANIDGTLGDGNTRGELITGFWSLLSPTNENTSYSLLTTLTYLGATYQTIIKATTVDQYRFDFAGELEIIGSDSGLVAFESIPTTNEECRLSLPSRVALQ